MSIIDFSGRLAIVTDAGGGLGHPHAMAMASRGAKVVGIGISNAAFPAHDQAASGS